MAFDTLDPQRHFAAGVAVLMEKKVKFFLPDTVYPHNKVRIKGCSCF